MAAAAAADALLCEDNFLCSICLDVFVQPVTVPCGHNYCMRCITTHWDGAVQTSCPLCQDVFERRPELRVNTFISEMAAQFRKSVQKTLNGGGVEELNVEPGDVRCDFCETETKAVKSCVACLASYCRTHLEPHRSMAALRRHKLIDPVRNVASGICQMHQHPLELFCRDDQTCVCRFCAESTHKLHHVIPMAAAFEAKKAKLAAAEAAARRAIHERRAKVREIRRSLELGQEEADREMNVATEIFTALMALVQKSLTAVAKEILEKQEVAAKQAARFVTALEVEISELEKRSSEIEELSRTEDQLRFLQRFAAPNAIPKIPPTKDLSEVRVQPSYEGTAMAAAARLQDSFPAELQKLCAAADLKNARRFTTDVTLDPETANRYLVLSADGKRVARGNAKQNLRHSAKRFSSCCVLGSAGFSGGRSYFEVGVEGKSEWILGVVRESVDRKNNYVTLAPPSGYWTVCLVNGDRYKACAGPAVVLRLASAPRRVGVFVDYEGRRVSFYDADAEALIYSFTGCDFREKVFPYFNPRHNDDGGENAAPLVIYSGRRDDASTSE